MGIDYIKCYGDLQLEIDSARDNLVTLNDNIRRIVGRSPKELRNDKVKKTDVELQKSNDTSKTKRRSHDAKSVFNRLSAPSPRPSVDDEHRPRVNSRVIRELPTRQEILAAQGTDSESRARNRRMFGSLLGTLHKFCQEESRLRQKEDKKAQVEKKVEEQELHERQALRKQRELLFLDRKRKQLEIKRLELKMNRLKDFEAWEMSTKSLKYHIKTKTKPHIYFKPRVTCKKTEKLLLENQTNIESLIEKKRESLNKELAEIEENFKMPEFEESMDTTNNEDEPRNGSETQNDAPTYSSTASEPTPKKGDVDSKENKSRNLNEPVLSSSVIVVKSESNDFNKTQ